MAGNGHWLRETEVPGSPRGPGMVLVSLQPGSPEPGIRAGHSSACRGGSYGPTLASGRERQAGSREWILKGEIWRLPEAGAPLPGGKRGHGGVAAVREARAGGSWKKSALGSQTGSRQ